MEKKIKKKIRKIFAILLEDCINPLSLSRKKTKIPKKSILGP